MTYQAGGNIQATDYNSLLLGYGMIGASQAIPYPSAASTGKKLAALIGVGFGDVGYGVVDTPIVPVDRDASVKSAEWALAIDKLKTVRDFLGQTSPATPAPPAPGDAATYLSTFQSQINAAYDARFSPAPANMSLVGLGSWALPPWSNSASFITTVTFASEFHARPFFNAGGEIRLALTHPTASATAQDTSWKSIVGSGFGVFSLKANSSSLSGTLSTRHTSSGYYQLTTSNSRVVNGYDVGAGAYASNDIYLDVRVANRAASFGGNGYTIIFLITLLDQHVNAWSDTVAAGLKLDVQAYKPNSKIIIQAPTVACTIASA